MERAVPEQNPYKILNVPQNASIEQIEDAYDTLFDAYEPQARAGDAAAVEFLHALNAARETLVNPQDRSESGGVGAVRSAAGTRVDAVSASITRRRGSRSVTQASSAPLKVRRRYSNASRPLLQPQTNPRKVPLLVAGTLLLVFLVAVSVFLLLRPKDTAVPAAAVDPARGEVVAAVNGAPIYADDWQIRIDKDKSGALSDPLFAPFINNFQGVTGTRMLDILSYDALDKLINLEVIQQQAKKEGLYPTQKQQETLISDAKKQDLKNGLTFEQFLKNTKITADLYNRTVIQNVVYTVMANQHLPKTGTPQERTDGFTKWICDTRKSYNVQIYRKFKVAENQPCTSGLPTDLPLPGLPAEGQGTPAPGAVPTAVPPVSPKATPKK